MPNRLCWHRVSVNVWDGHEISFVCTACFYIYFLQEKEMWLVLARSRRKITPIASAMYLTDHCFKIMKVLGKKKVHLMARMWSPNSLSRQLMGQATHVWNNPQGRRVAWMQQGEEGWMVGEGDGIAFRNALDSCPRKQSSSGDCFGPFLFQGANEF